MVGKQSLPTDYHENPETMEHEATDGRNWNISVYRSLQASLVAQMVKRLPAMREIRVRSLGWEDPLEKEMATHSSTLAWKIPWTEEPGRLQSSGCKESDTTEQLHFLSLFTDH